MNSYIRDLYNLNIQDLDFHKSELQSSLVNKYLKFCRLNNYFISF